MKKNISEIEGTVGKVFSKYSKDLRSINTKEDVSKFLDKVDSEMSNEARDYINTNVRSVLQTASFADIQRHMYNIYLAGFSDCKIC